MQLEQILSAAVAAVNQDDLTALTASVSSEGLHHQIPSPALPPQDSPTHPSAAMQCRPPSAASPFRSDPPDEGIGEVSFFPLDDDSLVITSQQALAMFEAPPAPPSRPPPLNTPPIPPPAPHTPVQYFGHPQEAQAEAVFVDLTPLTQVQAAQGTFAELQAVNTTLTEAEATFTELPMTEATFTEAPVTEGTFTEVPVAHGTFTEARAINETFAEATFTEASVVNGTFREATFTEAPVVNGTFTEAPGTETTTFTEMAAADHTFTGMEVTQATFPQVQAAETTFTQVPLAQGTFPEQYGAVQLAEMTAYPEVAAPPSLCGVPLTEVPLGEGEGVPDASAEVEVLTSEDSPQYTALTPAAPTPTPTDTPTSAPVVVEVAGPGLRLAIPNAFMSARQHDQTHTPAPTPPERPPDHSDVLSALRASIFRSRARKRAAPLTTRRKRKETGKNDERPPTPRPLAPHAHWGGGGRGE
ncbi:mucin-2-like [Scylla paramamosain]|uniref:mucin-2-like n=1 Tax=Scylla paramamosain TaxID=85552 RepID=UPI0030834695